MPWVNLADKPTLLSGHRDRQAVADCTDVMVVRAPRDVASHSHPYSSDVFLVLEGEREMVIADQDIPVSADKLFVVLDGIPHRPRPRPRARAESKPARIKARTLPDNGHAVPCAPKPRP